MEVEMINVLKRILRVFQYNDISDRMEVKKAIKFDSTVSFSDAAIEAGDVAVADGKIIVGGAAGKGVAQTPSGDVTMTNAGVVTIGAGKVLKTKVAYKSVAVTVLATATSGSSSNDADLVGGEIL